MIDIFRRDGYTEKKRGDPYETQKHSRSSQTAGHAGNPNIAEQLHAEGVEVMLAGNMGEGAKRVLERNDIRIIRGCSGDVVGVVKAYLAGDISDKGESCDHHNCAHH